MRSDPPRRPVLAPPVTCVACGADAFAVGEATTVGITLDLELDLRCGACGLWQQRRLPSAIADRFVDHLARTQRAIARELAAAVRDS